MWLRQQEEKDMNLFEFQLLASKEKTDFLQQNGVYIGKRKEGESVLLLYQLESFYVEIKYRKYRRFIANIRCFESTSVLDPYLEQIEVAILVG